MLYHNTQLQANIIIGRRSNTWVIPVRFLSSDDQVQLKDGELKHVQVGLRNDQWVEILDGINPASLLQKPEKL